MSFILLMSDWSNALQPSSACSCERNWSTYDYIHNKKRNRLEAQRAEKLVYIFSNLRLLKKLRNVSYEASREEKSNDNDIDA